MEVGDLLARFRLDTRDTVFPYMWSDAEVYAYINEAQNEFCRQTGGLADATSTECTSVALTAGAAFAAISPLVLKVRAAFGANGKKLDIMNFEDFEFSGTSGEELFADTAGAVRAVVVGMEPNRIKIIHTPAADQTISLVVYRMPLLEIEDESSDLEIDPQHHVSLLLWARKLAHSKADAETYDRGRAEQFAREFLNYALLARDEEARREHKYRSVQFSYW